MSEKSTGIDFDRQVFVQPEAPPTRPSLRIGGLIFALVAIVAMAILAYKVVPQAAKQSESAGDPHWLISINDWLRWKDGSIDWRRPEPPQCQIRERHPPIRIR